ncbi:pyridoxal-phosphate-dependent aminotransferase family protein [Oceanobacillus sp. CF4.6]|uniref:pyridoxal-phosphate-dependent aminotransferase family protein n=1 Tax=Oceanobacillus sp. CF4.6 TaxID=3373080 RepID=UPI003EE61583
MTRLAPIPRLLLGPGPSNLDPQVQSVVSAPLVGHLDPQFLEIMNESMDGLRQVYGTTNVHTVPISGTGSSGLEALITNLLEPGDECVVGVIGYFGQRLVDMAKRTGANVRIIEAPLGEILSPDQLEEELKRKPADVVALVHAETSTGACQPLKEMADVAHRYGALLVADCVTSLGGMPVDIDKTGVDAAGSCTQKCLAAPPGLGPITINNNAWERIKKRKTPVPSWYLDLSTLLQYWDEGLQQRAFHHTAPILSVYSLHEAVRLCLKEGLEARYERHSKMHRAFVAGLEAMGLSLFTPAGHRLPMLHVVNAPEGINEATVRSRLLEQNIEIAGGFGPLQGKTWRIGLMGYNARSENVLTLLSALELALTAEGFKVQRGAGVDAAMTVL